MQDLEYYIKLTEEAISKFGLDPEAARGKEKGQWNLQKGDIPIWIDVFKGENDPWGYFQCMSPAIVLKDGDNCELYEKLLEKNHSIFSVAITKYQNTIFIKIIRELTNITVEEIMNAVARVSTYAEKVKQEFGEQ